MPDKGVGYLYMARGQQFRSGLIVTGLQVGLWHLMEAIGYVGAMK